MDEIIEILNASTIKRGTGLHFIVRHAFAINQRSSTADNLITIDEGNFRASRTTSIARSRHTSLSYHLNRKHRAIVTCRIQDVDMSVRDRFVCRKTVDDR